MLYEVITIGNEIYDTHADERGQELTMLLRDEVLLHDPKANAVVTIGSNYMPWENAQKCADLIKFAGYNYGEKYRITSYNVCYTKLLRERITGIALLAFQSGIQSQADDNDVAFFANPLHFGNPVIFQPQTTYFFFM